MPNATIRSIAHKYSVSKTKFHGLFHTKLVLLGEKIYKKVLDKIAFSVNERARRGGKAGSKKIKSVKTES